MSSTANATEVQYKFLIIFLIHWNISLHISSWSTVATVCSYLFCTGFYFTMVC
jgi:hypothetical protein